MPKNNSCQCFLADSICIWDDEVKTNMWISKLKPVISLLLQTNASECFNRSFATKVTARTTRLPETSIFYTTKLFWGEAGEGKGRRKESREVNTKEKQNSWKTNREHRGRWFTNPLWMGEISPRGSIRAWILPHFPPNPKEKVPETLGKFVSAINWP